MMTLQRTSFLAVCATLGTAGLAFAMLGKERELPEFWPPQFYILLAGALTVSFLMERSRSRKLVLAFSGLNLFLFAVMLYPEGGNTILSYFFLFALALQVQVTCSVSAIQALGLLVFFLAVVSFHPVRAGDLHLPNPTLQAQVLRGLCLLSWWLVNDWLRRSHDRRMEQAAEIQRLTTATEQLSNANLDFQNYLVEAGERSTREERKRISRDIHDTVGYTLINLKMLMEGALGLIPKESVRLQELLVQARDQAYQGLLETRNTMRMLRSIEEHNLRGIPNLQRLVKTFAAATGTRIEISYGNMPWSFGEPIDSVIYRITQEGMTNAFRHGRATAIEIGFWVVEQVLQIRIFDNGAGAPVVTPGIGLTGMAERLGRLNGSLHAGNVANGFVVSATIPLEDGQHE